MKNYSIMDKEQETLDMVLDIPNTGSLNPFERPPNIMDDDLNSVTQEELEANLSTDCPANAMDATPTQNCNDMWEKLIQSFLEDNSTQDGVIQSVEAEEATFDAENVIKKSEPEDKIVNSNKTLEAVIENEEKISSTLKDHENGNLRNLNEQELKSKVYGESFASVEGTVIKDEHIMDITIEEEQMITCMYDFNEDDAQNDLCQVEVYATCHKNNTKQEIEENVETKNLDETEDDCLSNISSESLGYLEPIKIEETCEERLIKEELFKKNQLSTIISDHCYSQEGSANATESDVLKQNIINHIMKQNISKRKIHQISNFVDSLLNDMDNNKLELMLNAMNIREVNREINDSSIKEVKTYSESVNEADKVGTQIFNEEMQQKHLEVSLNGTQILLNEVDKGQHQENLEHNAIAIETSAISSQHYELAQSSQKDKENIRNENILPQSAKNEYNKASDTEFTENKSVNGTLPFNCSETLEHQIFDEEFDMLCKNGVLPLTKSTLQSNAYSQLLDKLKDFVSQIQKDCEDLSLSSVEEKLQDYIKMQYCNYQKLFVFKQSVETQTKRKKLKKRPKKSKNSESFKNLMKSNENLNRYSSTSAASSSSSPCSSSDENEIEAKTTLSFPKETTPPTSEIKSLPHLTSKLFNNASNNGQEYDDGINLSQYVQSEIFNIESLSPQSTIISDSECDSSKEEIDASILVNKQVSPNEEDDSVGESDDTIIFKISSKKSKKSNESQSENSSADTKKANKNQDDQMSVHSESDKENLSSDRKEKKTNESMDEDERNDREIDRLTNINALVKRPVCNTSSTKNKIKPKATAAKSLNDRFDFMDIDFGSEDEVKSETEEEVITEQQFLRNFNEDIKRQMLNDSSTDSEALEEEDDELLKASSEDDDECGTKSPLVEKFLKTFVVDDSDNDIEDNDDDDDIDLDSDKDEGEKGKEKPENKDDVANADIDKTEKDDDGEILIDGEIPTNAEMELLNDNFLFRKRFAKPQKLDKMLSDAEKRKNISKIDAELISLSSDSSHSDVEAVDVETNQKPRSLKPMLRPDQLAGETIKAQKHENERISRLEKKHVMLDKILKEHPEVDKNKELILDFIKETKTFIKVHPGIVKYLKPHQFDGVRFMYDSCYGGVDSLKKSPGSGCILAHCMGLGKTLQLISLLHTVISYKELKTTKILVLCPKSTVMNWADEIIRWLGPLRQKNVKVYTFSDTSDINEKLSIVKEWSLSNHSRAGCLLIGYEAFRTLVFYHSYKNRGNINSERLEEIRLNVNKYLLAPGADLVVCDEGHIIKNSNSAISKAVAKIETPRRIVLTGTPIQNNLKEYYSMVNFIKPLFLGTEKEFANLYANPIKNGQHKDSGKTDIKIMKQRSFVLHKKLSKFVQRKEAELLKTFLPTKFEYVLFIPMTEVQNNLYQHILNAIKNRDENYRGKGLITDYTCLRKIWTHPKVLEDAWKNAISQRNKKETRNKLLGHNSDDDQPDDIYDSQTGQMSVTNDWWRHLVNEADLESVMPSNKLRTMFKILQMCEEKGEKCLIFSAFVAVLNVVEYFFKKITENDSAVLNELNINHNCKWVLGHDYYRLDGKTPKSIRHAMINEFNNIDNKMARVFLISAKAGGQGINLIGANRVIILDTSWNPSNDQQNIFRVFRLGQKRCCYIYRLLAIGTMEEKVYSRSVTKQAMSFRVVDEQQIDRHYNMAELAELYTLTVPDKNSRPTPILPQDSILARLLRAFPDLVYKYHEHDSLLENKVEQELSEQEKNEAWTAYERDLQMNSEAREMPNIEDFQNKFNATNLSNYLSPFSGLDVSNNQNANNSKNMSHLLGYNRGFNPNFLHSLLGQNPSSGLNGQQYMDLYNYYKNLNYADINPYAHLSGLNTGGGPGRMPPSAAPPTVPTNPLAALGDLSMFGLSSSALQTLGANPAAMNLPNSLGSSAAALPQMPPAASMYTTPSAMATNLPMTSASTLAAGGLASTSNNAAVLSAYEQFKQSFRGTYNSMYNYTGDFGLSSSGSTILDSSKTKNSKQQNNNSNKNVNLPGGSKGGSNMSLFSGPPPPYMPQIQTQQQHAQQQRPSSRNTPNYEQQQQKQQQQQQQQHHQQQQQQQQQQQSKTKSTTSSTKSPDSNVSSRSSSLLSYRRSAESSSVASKQSNENLAQSKPNPLLQQKKSDGDNNNSTNAKSMLAPTTKGLKTSANSSSLLASNQKSNQKSTTSQINNNSSSNSLNSSKLITTSSPLTSTPSSTSVQADSNRAMNMGILYPNSKVIDKTPKQNSTVNMGIIYPNSSKKSTSEMQIIPTSSPPGTISISKQLNELSPSISLTALKTNVPNKMQQHQSTKSSTGLTSSTSNVQINKIMQNNVRRNTSPISANSSTASSGNKSNSTNNLNSSSSVSTNSTAQSNLLTRIKMANSKKPTNTNNNNGNSVPPLQRSTTMVSIPTTNTSTKTPTGLTITNVKSASKNQNNITKPGLTNQQQASTLAKQNAAAAVAKSNINRLNSSARNSSDNSNTTSNTNLPSLTAIKRIIRRNSPTAAVTSKPPALTSSPSLSVTSSNKLPIISSVKSISPYSSSMATISKASITKVNNSTTQSSNNSTTATKLSSSTKTGSNPQTAPNVSKTLAQIQKRLPTSSQATPITSTSTNSSRNTVNIRPVDAKQNSTGSGSVYIIETNINDKKLAIGAPTRSGGGTTVTKVPTQTAMKRKATDPLSKDKSIETKRLKN